MLSGATAAAVPQRVVSLHLCADQLMLKLADRSQIAAVTRIASQPAYSVVAEEAAGIPAIAGTAEEVVAFAPDLVFAGPLSARSTVRILRSLGYRLIDLDLVQDFAGIRRQVREVAAALGHPDRGERMVAGIDARLAAWPAPTPGERKLAIVYQANGFTPGPGSLAHEVLVAAGFENLSARLGLGSLGRLPLERLIASAPQVIVTNDTRRSPALAYGVLTHAALRHLDPPPRFVAMPERLWTCGGWFTAEAVTLLRRAVGAPRLLNRDSRSPPPLRGRSGRGVSRRLAAKRVFWRADARQPPSLTSPSRGEGNSNLVARLFGASQ
jgi:iron complex transport system substrate-binding protein